MSRASGAALAADDPRSELEEIEIRLLLEGVYLSYGYDFRDYAHNSIRRSIVTAMARENVRTVSAYQDLVLHDAACMQRFLATVGVNVTGMFRDPALMLAVRKDVVPLLASYPSARVWIAGCASGEEAFSFAIALHEEGVLDRCTIYATDLNEDLLAIARLGAYSLDRIRRSEEAYRLAGGRGALSDHYAASSRMARFDPTLQRRITWARHNLVSDGSFNDFHLIVCANVLIYFGADLQQRAHRLLYDSLVRGGYLALGRRESLLYCADHEHYAQVRDAVNLFRKTRW